MEKYLINPNQRIAKINKDIYGNFSEHLGRCIYDGIFVGEDSKIPNVNGMRSDVVEALREMGLPVLRWPGGCFADEYHWKDGIGKKENRKKWLTPTGEGLLRIIPLELTNILNSAVSSDAIHISTETLAREQLPR